ncbi:hypothetical protein [Chishuiella changwenlii]|uniref:hypothetical protein n=1 Tax=Chishuiella changwenlii TaxID=1434701 RepID=UPI002FD91824
MNKEKRILTLLNELDEKRVLTLLNELNTEERKNILRQLTQPSLNAQIDNKFDFIKSIFGIAIVFLSALLPFIDNFLELLFPNINEVIKVAYFTNFLTVIWSFCISFTPLLIIFSLFLSVNKLVYVFPIISGLVTSTAVIINSTGYYITGKMQFYIFITLISIAVIVLFKKIYNFLLIKKLSEELKMKLINLILKED